MPIVRDFPWYNLSTIVPAWKYDSFGATVVLGRLVRGELFDHARFPALTTMVGAGVLYAAAVGRRREMERWLLLLFVFFLALYFGRPTWGPLLNLVPLGRGFHYSRAVYLVHSVGAILAGIAIGAAYERSGAVARGAERSR